MNAIKIWRVNESHGASSTRLYRIWHGMKQRCNNPKVRVYKYYGGRGIKVCEEWEHSFTAFKEWAAAHGYADNLEIDRKDNDKGYSPNNCRWISKKDNLRNRRSYAKSNRRGIININGESKTMKEWANISGISFGTLRHRYYRQGLRGADLIKPIEPGKTRKAK